MSDQIQFYYKNHRGVTELRTVRPINLGFLAVPPYYPEPVWLMRAWCMDRRAERSFELTKCIWVNR